LWIVVLEKYNVAVFSCLGHWNLVEMKDER
jgi:hypothetical protein